MLTALTDMILRRTVRRWFEHEPDYVKLRAKLDAFVARTDPMPRGWRVQDAGMAAGARLSFIEDARSPAADTAPLVLYFHGGGYIVGGLKSHGAFCARLAKAVGGRVLFADYRLAPEHPFPAAVEDGVAAFLAAATWARGKLFIAGDSAGGGLALAVAQAAARPPDSRKANGLILISPWVDLTLAGASMIGNAPTDAMLSMSILRRMRTAYLNGAEPADRRASPLFEPNTHLPPTLLIYSASEVLRDDAVRLAENLRLGGTQVREAVFAGKPHVFPVFRTVPGAGKALREIADFVAA